MHPEFGFDLNEVSNCLSDILMAKTTSAFYDKRKNAGEGRGLEFWRVLRRDFGMASADAQHAKLHLYMRPAKATMATLGSALDKWEALGTEIGRPVDDDFKLIALRELVPREVGDLMAAQVSLKSFPAALAYVRRHVLSRFMPLR